MKQKKRYRVSPLAWLIHALLPLSAHGTGLHFDPSMISGDGSVASLSEFEQGATVLPGRYPVDIYVNGNKAAGRVLTFNLAKGPAADVHDASGLRACLTRDDLAGLGVKVTAFPDLMKVNATRCLSPGRYIPEAYTAFDPDTMRLDVSIPQAAMAHRPQGWVSPRLWDEGINAALLSWQLSGSHNAGQYGNSHSEYLNLNSGLNLGAWRLRDNSTWSSSENNYSHTREWRHLNTYAGRDIIPWRSELTLGDSTSSDTVFDAFSFRGVRLATSDSMYPDSQRGYSPEIKGVAGSNAEVSVSQNGSVIYRTYVAPGAFVIDDLNALGAAGDLTVTVREADGNVRIFTVPYSSIPVLQRAGHVRYALVAGRYRSAGGDTDNPAFAQGTLQWGLPHGVTLYGGLLQAQKYHSAALGLGMNLGDWGAVSADVTQANSILPDGSHHAGQSVRFLYSRSLLSTGTTFQLAGYRYSTQGFHTLSDTAVKAMSGWYKDDTQVDAAGRALRPDWHNYYNLYNSRRQQVTVSLSQSLGGFGSVFLNGAHQTYWQSDASTDSLQAGLSNTFHSVSYSLSYGYSRFSGQDKPDRTLFLALSLPLGGATSNPVYVSTSANRDSEGNMTFQTGVNGSAADNSLSWAASQGYDRRDGGSGDASLDYTGNVGDVSAGYGYSRNYRQARYGASGSLVVHSGGVTFGQPLGDTSVLIDAPGARDVRIADQRGIHTDGRGYAIVPYASRYQTNDITLDISSLDNQTDVDDPVVSVVPTAGAVVRAHFRVHSGVHALLTLLHDGKPLPFGTVVASGAGSGGLVGDGGDVYLTGLPLQVTLKAQWGKGHDQRCESSLSLSADALSTPLTRRQLNCQ